ncbi:MAG: POTRA domain-containing protein [Planctomycetota bacterium]
MAWRAMQGLVILSVAAAVCFAVAARALAQDTLSPAAAGLAAEGPFDGRRVERVEVLVMPVGGDAFAPPDARLGQLVRNQIRLGRGSREYSGRVATDDLARLNRLGRFVQAEHLVTPLQDGSVVVTYRLREQPFVRDVQVTGNRRLGTLDLRDAIDALPGTPFDRFEMDRAARRIEELYRERGYYLADVRVNTDDLVETGVVLFEIREGTRVRVTAIRFEGNSAVPDRLLRDEITVRKAGIFGRGPLDQRQLREDATSIARFYEDRGYLDARADFLVTQSPDGREAIVTFFIVEGELYSLSRVTAVHDDARPEGPVLTAEQIVGLIGMKPGDTFSTRAADQAVRTVRDAYGKMGYTDASVIRREVRDPLRPAVELLLTIREGPRYRTGLVQISGNRYTKQSEVRRSVRVEPDRPLDTTAVDLTRRLVSASGLFETFGPQAPDAIIQPPSPDNPGSRDVLVDVTETRTGNLAIGASVNSDAALSGRISYTERNFDITDVPSSLGELLSGQAFRGGGQTLQLEASPGTTFQTYRLSLEDRSIADSFIGGSVAGGFRVSLLPQIDTQRLFATAGLRRRFGERWVASLRGRWESVQPFDLEPDSTLDAFAVEGTNILTGVRFGVTRNTVPPAERFRPSSGTITELAVEQVGVFGGDFDYTSLSAEHSVFLALRRNYQGQPTVLRLRTSAEWVPQGQDSVPIYERYYLGGRSLRGLDFRTVAPRGLTADTLEIGETVGGTFSFFAGVELQQPIYTDSLALAFFVDSGTVLEEIGLEDYRVTAGIGLRVYIRGLSPAPLAFDFALPITKEDVDDTRLFTFTVDLPL